MARNIDRLIEIMRRLRDPETGCPWDRTQTYATIAPYTIEEAYEVAEAIEGGNPAAILDEVGDLLFQVIYYAEFGREDGTFDFEAIAGAAADKMIRRHPHVFAAEEVDSATHQLSRWEDHKAVERHRKAEAEGRPPSALDGVATGLPALTRALKLQKRAARVGFDWVDPRDILDKIVEEANELRTEIDAGAGPDRVRDELGDLLFALVNLARRYDIDAEAALRGTNAKFTRRFQAIEAGLAAEGRTPENATLEEMEALWQAAKAKE